MDIEEIYHFLFQTYAGVGILVLACMVICLIVAFVLERKTRRQYADRGPRKPGEDDAWSLFEDDDEEGNA